MTCGLSESAVVRELAHETCTKLTRKLRVDLQRTTDCLTSGDDSPLKNAWEELCVQVQGEQSIAWEDFEAEIRLRVTRLVESLRGFERDAIWLQTRQREDWGCEDEADRDPNPVCSGDIVEYLVGEYAYPLAGKWTNQRIREFLDACLATAGLEE